MRRPRGTLASWDGSQSELQGSQAAGCCDVRHGVACRSCSVGGVGPLPPAQGAARAEGAARRCVQRRLVWHRWVGGACGWQPRGCCVCPPLLLQLGSCALHRPCACAFCCPLRSGCACCVCLPGAAPPPSSTQPSGAAPQLEPGCTARHALLLQALPGRRTSLASPTWQRRLPPRALPSGGRRRQAPMASGPRARRPRAGAGRASGARTGES